MLQAAKRREEQNEARKKVIPSKIEQDKLQKRDEKLREEAEKIRQQTEKKRKEAEQRRKQEEEARLQRLQEKVRNKIRVLSGENLNYFIYNAEILR